jgi:hypothetical protein
VFCGSAIRSVNIVIAENSICYWAVIDRN